MASFQRPQVATLYRRLAEPPRQLIALFGPRQTGKTTIVRQALRQIDLGSRYLAVDEPDSTEFRVPLRYLLSILVRQRPHAATTLRHPPR